MREVKAFGCDYCGMTSRYKASVERHQINSCRKSPDRKTCKKCINLDFDTDDGYYCDQIESYIHAPLNLTVNCDYFEVKK